MANRLFRGADPIGRLVETGFEPEHPATIVGVVGDIKLEGLEQASPAVVYCLYGQIRAVLEQFGFYGRAIVLRVDGDPASLALDVRASLRRFDPNAPVDNYVSMADAITNSMTGRRSTAVLLLVFTGAAVILAAIGVYGMPSPRRSPPRCCRRDGPVGPTRWRCCRNPERLTTPLRTDAPGYPAASRS